MLKTIILAIIEPLSFSLDKSLSWKLTTALQAKTQFQLIGTNGDTSTRSLIGLVPILQPIRASIGSQPVFMVFMRGLVTVSGDFNPPINTSYSVVTPQGQTLATIIASSTTKQGEYVVPFTLISSEVSPVASESIAALQGFIKEITGVLWQAEPINWTTHKLHLTAKGTFLPADEMTALNILSGTLVVKGSDVSIQAGINPKPIAFRAWRGAGRTVPLVAGAASGSSYCSAELDASSGSGSSGGDFGSGGGGSCGGQSSGC